MCTGFSSQVSDINYRQFGVAKICAKTCGNSRDRGHESLGVYDGSEVVSAMHEFVCDLIITDHAHPGHP